MTVRIPLKGGAGLLLALAALLTGCALAGEHQRPAWIDEPRAAFPNDDVLAGVGLAETRQAATERAYEAVARIFTAEVRAQSKDWESYVRTEGGGQPREERRLAVDRLIRISTNKVLENVRVLDSWVDPTSGTQYVLAGMNRAQAAAALLERIAELDGRVRAQVETARQTQDTLAVIRNLGRSMHDLVLREAYNADLRVVRLSGRGEPPPYDVAALRAELERFLRENLIISVQVSGEESETIRRAVMEGLIGAGLPVTDRPPEKASVTLSPDGHTPLALLVEGSSRLWRADVADPMFSYARWCADFVILDVATGRILGAVSRRGREGHVTDVEARARALRVMQQELTAELAKSLAGYIYGDTEASPNLRAPAACSRDPMSAETPGSR